MASTDTKPGFRLPWSPDRSDGIEATEAQETETNDMLDAAPAAPTHVAAAEPVADPVADAPPTTTQEPAEAAQPAPDVPAAAPARKPNKLMADLTRAMQAAAESARTDSLERFSAEAKSHIESIHATSAEEATELRKQADDDVAGIRDWSKTEIARIREETDERIAHRKSGLEHEIEEHAAAIERRIERVQARVTAFEEEMAAFFERLLAEDDPTRLAAMAESLPEPPPFGPEWDDIPTPVKAPAAPTPETAPAVEAAVEVVVEAAPTDPVESVESVESVEEAVTETVAADDGDLFSIGTEQAPTDGDPRIAALGLSADFAAAEAEAAAFIDDGSGTEDDIPVIADDALAARIAGLVSASDDVQSETTSTRLVVTGLVSVASIAGFKRHLSRASGVTAVGVSSGPDGEFIFAVTHDPSIALRDVVAVLPGFGARVTAESDGQLTVAATDPETEH